MPSAGAPCDRASRASHGGALHRPSSIPEGKLGDNTLIQFGTTLEHDSPPETRRSAGVECPACRQHFSSDARFCPFDGESLRAAVGYDPGADPLLGTVLDQRYRVERVTRSGGRQAGRLLPVIEARAAQERSAA